MRKVLLTLATAMIGFFLFLGCQKDLVGTENPSEFGDLNYSPLPNLQLRSLEGIDDIHKENFKIVIDTIMKRNTKKPFVVDFVSKYGKPVWNEYYFIRDSNNLIYDIPTYKNQEITGLIHFSISDNGQKKPNIKFLSKKVVLEQIIKYNANTGVKRNEIKYISSRINQFEKTFNLSQTTAIKTFISEDVDIRESDIIVSSSPCFYTMRFCWLESIFTQSSGYNPPIPMAEWITNSAYWSLLGTDRSAQAFLSIIDQQILDRQTNMAGLIAQGNTRQGIESQISDLKSYRRQILNDITNGADGTIKANVRKKCVDILVECDNPLDWEGVFGGGGGSGTTTSLSDEIEKKLHFIHECKKTNIGDPGAIPDPMDVGPGGTNTWLDSPNSVSECELIKKLSACGYDDGTISQLLALQSYGLISDLKAISTRFCDGKNDPALKHYLGCVIENLLIYGGGNGIPLEMAEYMTAFNNIKTWASQNSGNTAATLEYYAIRDLCGGKITTDEQLEILNCIASSSTTQEDKGALNDFYLNTTLVDPCTGDEIDKDPIMAQVCAGTGGVTMAALDEALAKIDVIIIDKSLDECPLIECGISHALKTTQSRLCEIVTTLQQSPIKYILKLGNSSQFPNPKTAAVTSQNSVTGISEVYFNPNFCKSLEVATQSDRLNVVLASIHELLHVYLDKQLIELYLAHGKTLPISQNFVNKFNNLLAEEKYCVHTTLGFHDHHKIMGEKFVNDFATTLWEANGKKGNPDDYLWFAWQGLYIDGITPPEYMSKAKHDAMYQRFIDNVGLNNLNINCN